MKNKEYKLRPHHVEKLFNFISYGEKGEWYVRGTINEVDTMEAIFSEFDGVPVEYNKDFVDSLVNYYEQLVNDKNSYLKIVDGIDDICLLGKTGCNRRRPACEDNEVDSYPQHSLEEDFGMKINGVYKISKILDKLKTKN